MQATSFHIQIDKMMREQNYLVYAEVDRLFDPDKGNRNASRDRNIEDVEALTTT